MNTPIYDFVKTYAESGTLRLHMPGHKGAHLLGGESLDITEITGADSLYHADGIILESENNATSLFGSRHTYYSAEGSSLCIRAMLYLLKRHAERIGASPRILVGRNAHKTLITAAALLDIAVDWIFPSEGSYLSCNVNADELDKRLSESDEKPVAVYVTSPDYLGNVSDVEGIGKVCRKHGVLLAVDNAHGAYLKFLSPSRHPIDLGAHICCDSAHKTLPVLTGGAYLHIAEDAPLLLTEEARAALSLFGSTSPSYLILQSLDLANRYMSDRLAERLREFIDKVDSLKERLIENGLTLVGNEPLKLTVWAKASGYTGIELALEISKRGGECEFFDPDVTVMMISPQTGDLGLSKLSDILLSIPVKNPIDHRSCRLIRPRTVMSPREALFSDSEELLTDDCIGRIQASASVACPPAVPIVVCGEVIDADAIQILKYYGIEKCRVVKK